MDNLPEELASAEIDRLFRAAEIAHFSENKRRAYEEDIMRERDYWAQLRYAKDTGVEQGLAETAMNLKAMGMSFEFILKATGLSEDKLKRILS